MSRGAVELTEQLRDLTERPELQQAGEEHVPGLEQGQVLGILDLAGRDEAGRLEVAALEVALASQ